VIEDLEQLLEPLKFLGVRRIVSPLRELKIWQKPDIINLKPP